jgi:hypothetical protein
MALNLHVPYIVGTDFGLVELIGPAQPLLRLVAELGDVLYPRLNLDITQL